MAPLSLALVLFSSLVSAQDAAAPAPAPSSTQQTLQGGAALSQTAAAAPNDAAAKDTASAAFNGGDSSADAVPENGDGQARKRLHLIAGKPSVIDAKDVPAPNSKPKSESRPISTGVMLVGAGALGALQGAFAGGLAGALGGAGLGIAAAWMFHKGDYGAAFGITAGGIIGSVMGGPLGALAGAAIGGLVGHFIGKLFHH